jgi:hypothetical protein
MNKYIILTLSALSIGLVACASTQAKDEGSKLNPIRVFNKSNTDIAYIVRGTGPIMVPTV